MKNHLLYGIISESDEENIKTQDIYQGKQAKNLQRSNEEVLKLYKKMIGDNSKDQPLPKASQPTYPGQQKTKFEVYNDPKNNFTNRTKDPDISTHKNTRQMSFQLSSLSPNLPTKEGHRIPNKNSTNYSEGYKQSKPFSLRKQAKTTTVYNKLDQEPNVPPSPETSVKQTRRQNFVKKLNQNIIKDREKETNRIARTVMQMRAQDKKLREDIRQINKQERQLQERVRQYHTQYKQYCKQIQEKYSLNQNFMQIQKSFQQILTLGSQRLKSQTHISSKKMQIIEQYKPYTDKIQLEIRKIDQLIKLKKENIHKQELEAEKSIITQLLREPIDDSLDVEEQERPIVQGPTYKEIMRARKNKDFSKVQQLITETRGGQSSLIDGPSIPNDISEIAGEHSLYQTNDGQMRVNQRLKNLLLN